MTDRIWHVSVMDQKDFHWTVEAFSTRRQAYKFKRQLEHVLDEDKFTVYIHNTQEEMTDV